MHTHALVTRVLNVSERDTSQDRQFSKEKDVPAVSLGKLQGVPVDQNRDTEHQVSEMVGTTSVYLQHKPLFSKIHNIVTQAS